MNRGIKLSAFLLLLGSFFVGTSFCKKPVVAADFPAKTVTRLAGDSIRFERAVLDAIKTTNFIKDRKITIKIPSAMFKDSRENAAIVIDMRFKGFGGIYKPLKSAKSVNTNFALKDISKKNDREVIGKFIENLKTDVFSLFILKTIVLNDSLGSGVVFRVADKPVKYGENDFDSLVAYLFARLAQSAVGKSTFFEKHTSLEIVENNLSPVFMALMSEELELKLSKIYESYKNFSSAKINPFIAEKSTVGNIIFKTLMAFDKVEAKYKEEAVTDAAAKNLRAITDEYKDAKKNLRNIYREDSKATKKLEILADKVRKLKKDKKLAEIKYNQLFVEKYPYFNGKTIVALLIPAVAKLKSAIKDVAKVNQMYNVLAPLYDIGISVKIFYGKIKAAASAVAGGLSFFARIKQAPAGLVNLVKEKITGVTQAAKEEVAALHEEAVSGVTSVKEGVGGEIESVKSEVSAAGKEVKGEISDGASSAKSELRDVKGELSREMTDAQAEIESEVISEK